jgi:carbon-monoxide dehydrogenase medium subunit
MMRHVDVAGSDLVKNAIPALGRLVGEMADPTVRNRGTIGGSIAHNDPAADYPASLVALNAAIITNRRKIAADDFFTSRFRTALEKGEIIVAVSFPIPEKAAYMKFANSASRYAIVGIFVAKNGDDVRVAVAGAKANVFRAKEMELALKKSFTPDAIRGITINPDGLNCDIHATPDYRAHLVSVMAQRAIAAAARSKDQ